MNRRLGGDESGMMERVIGDVADCECCGIADGEGVW